MRKTIDWVRTEDFERLCSVAQASSVLRTDNRGAQRLLQREHVSQVEHDKPYRMLDVLDVRYAQEITLLEERIDNLNGSTAYEFTPIGSGLAWGAYYTAEDVAEILHLELSVATKNLRGFSKKKTTKYQAERVHDIQYLNRIENLIKEVDELKKGGKKYSDDRFIISDLALCLNDSDLQAAAAEELIGYMKKYEKHITRSEVNTLGSFLYRAVNVSLISLPECLSQLHNHAGGTYRPLTSELKRFVAMLQ